jgi:hypothetical protein
VLANLMNTVGSEQFAEWAVFRPQRPPGSRSGAAANRERTAAGRSAGSAEAVASSLVTIWEWANVKAMKDALRRLMGTPGKKPSESTSMRTPFSPMT